MVNVQKINGLLKKTTHHDKDERFMATSDLTTELEKVDGILEKSMQIPIRNAILRQLEDSSSDVQTVAVKCLSTLVRKFNATQVVGIVQKLGKLVVDPQKSESRDIYAIGLKTIIAAVPEENGEAIAKKLVDCLIIGLRNPSRRSGPDPDDLEATCLDTMKDVLQRFGGLLTTMHEDILKVIMPRLDYSNNSIRRRASVTISVLVLSLADGLFHFLMDTLIQKMKTANTSSNSEFLYTYIQTVGVISQGAGSRVGKYLSQIVPKLETFCNLNDMKDDGEESEAMVELWENCLQAYRSIIFRCPKEVGPHIQNINDICLQFISYDPNYSYEEDDDNDYSVTLGYDESDQKGDDTWDDGSDEDGWDNEDDEQLMEEDDDTSWKVRLAAVGCLATFITNHPDKLAPYYETLCQTFMSRFKERDQKVKSAIFSATCNLLQQSIPMDANEKKSTLSVVLVNNTETLIKQVCKQLKSGTAETKKAGFGVIRELIIVRHGNLQDYFPLILPYIIQAINADDAQLKIEGLIVLGLILDNHTPEQLASQIFDITRAIIYAVGDPYLKVKAIAIKVCGSLVKSLPAPSGEDWESTTRSLKRRKESGKDEEKTMVSNLYQISYQQLLLKDMDQVVKEASLTTMSLILSRFGHLLRSNLEDVLPVIRQRLDNELTRLSALRALAKIASSSLELDLGIIIAPCVKQLCTFMRKESQILKHETVVTLTALIQSPGVNKLSPRLCTNLLKEIIVHIVDEDLYLCSIVLNLISNILRIHPKVDSTVATHMVRHILVFIRSPLLQGSALTNLVILFQDLLRTKSPDISYQKLGEVLLSAVDDELPLANCIAIAQCIASMTKLINETEKNKTIQRFLKASQNGKNHQRRISLLILGEIGREQDISAHSHVETVIFSSFKTDNDDIRNAASFALGNISVGNMHLYLPLLLKMIEEQAEMRYLLFASLKEIIVRYSLDSKTRRGFAPYFDTVKNILFANAESDAENIRSSVAACIGGLVIIHSGRIFPDMMELVCAKTPYTRAVIISALRYSIAPSSAPLIQANIPAFLECLQDPDLGVRRQCIITVNAIANADVSLLMDVLHESILPVLYKETVPNEKLVRLVDLGPFKHRIDDGLTLRKASYQTLATLLDALPNSLNIIEFIGHVKAGIIDHDDIQIVTYAIFLKLGQLHPAQLAKVLDQLPPIFMKGIKAKLKESKGSDPERAKDVLLASVRTLSYIDALPEADPCEDFKYFYARVKTTKLLAQMLATLQQQNRTRI